MQREPNTEYILSLSYGKDSIACLEAIIQLGYPLDRIIHAEVWATDTIPADLPPMIDFKAKADKIIKERYGFTVEHICAVRGGKKLSYESQFYEWINQGRNRDRIYGFPYTLGAWCNSRLKVSALQSIARARESNLRETVLPYSKETKETQYRRGRDSKQILPMDSQCSGCRGATQDSNSRHSDNSILGFPIPRGNWCNSNLKLASLRISNINRQRELVYPTQTEGFLPAPLHKGQRKILCSIWELQQMSQSELKGTAFPARFCHS